MSATAPNENPLAEDLAHVLTHTRELWEAARGRRIFITGGTGFFGRWLLESFAHANEMLQLDAGLVVLSRNPAAFAADAPHLAANSAIRLVQGDVQAFNTETVRAQLTDAPERYNFFIHAATDASAKLNADDPLHMIDTAVQGTRAALEFAVSSGTRRFLLTSSGAVYGPQPADMTHIAEDYLGGPDCTAAASAYGEGKRMAELLCVCFQKKYGIEPLIARCFAFVGPFLPLDKHFAIGNFLRDCSHGEEITIAGDGTPRRSYLYAADLAIWLWTILFRGEPARAYNVGSEDDRSIRQIADAVAETRADVHVVVQTPADPSPPLLRYVPSCQRAADELGLREWIALPEAIRRTKAYAVSLSRQSCET